MKKNLKAQKKSQKKREFILKKGQIDYHNARWAPVINCVLEYKDKILVVQRSNDLSFYPGYWNGISGFLDDHLSLEEKVKDEINEETGISPNEIISIEYGEIFHQEELKYGKTWIVYPVLVKVRSNSITLDWEGKQYKWIGLEEAKKLSLLPGFNLVLERLFSV